MRRGDGQAARLGQPTPEVSIEIDESWGLSELDAVLEAAVLGRYDGPAFAPRDDTLATVRNYVRRDGTWNADASRRIEAKIQSLLAQNTTPAAAGRSAKARQ